MGNTMKQHWLVDAMIIAGSMVLTFYLGRP